MGSAGIPTSAAQSLGSGTGLAATAPVAADQGVGVDQGASLLGIDQSGAVAPVDQASAGAAAIAADPKQAAAAAAQMPGMDMSGGAAGAPPSVIGAPAPGGGVGTPADGATPATGDPKNAGAVGGASGGGMPGMPMPLGKPGQSPGQIPVDPVNHSGVAGTIKTGQLLTAADGATFTVGQQMVMDHDNHGMGLHSELIRTSPNNMQLANQVMQASLKLLAPLTWNGTTGGTWVTFGAANPNGSHRVIPASVKAEWAKEYPNLPVPSEVVFDPKTHQAVGAMFTSSKGPVDLGMGAGHEHTAGGSFMQHIWFTPNDLTTAFSDTTDKTGAIAAADAAATARGTAPVNGAALNARAKVALHSPVQRPTQQPVPSKVPAKA
jgi:hypothetical protein